MHIVSRQPNKSRPDRVAPLAVLPVFFDLIGKRVVAIGGSEPATWKIELLAAAGAHVQVLAPIAEWCDDLIALAESGAAAGTISLVDCHWAPSDLSGAALAVADIEDDAEARAFVEASRPFWARPYAAASRRCCPPRSAPGRGWPSRCGPASWIASKPVRSAAPSGSGWWTMPLATARPPRWMATSTPSQRRPLSAASRWLAPARAMQTS